MDFSITMDMKECELLVAAYSSNIAQHFEVTMTDLIYPKVKDMTTNITYIRKYYEGNNGIAYIDQVFSDSVSIIKNNPRKSYSLDLFINDMNFSLDSAKKIATMNSDHIDILSNHLVDLFSIEEMVYYVLDHINNCPNRIAIEATLSLEELIMSLMQLKAVLKKHLYQINHMQQYALEIINKVGAMKASLLNAPGNLDEDEDY